MKDVIYNEYKAEKFLKKYLPVSKNQLVQNIDQIKFRKFPLYIKIISDQALHKSDIKGVRLVRDKEDLEKNFKELLQISKKRKLKLDGILVQEPTDGEFVIIGIKKDPVFGHVILFGLGGIFTEVLKDISIRKCPITKFDAEQMINELRAKDIFNGARHRKLNVDLLKRVLIKTSHIPLKHKKIKELDINPFVLNEKTGKVVDARIVFEE